MRKARFSMTPLGREWVEKAEADIATARRELAVTESPNYDAVCFHAQQCAEKYLKGLLQDKGIEFPKTHDLVELMGLAAETDPPLEELRDHLQFLSEFSVDVRYPGVSADEAMAREALDIAQEVRRRARRLLGLES